MRTLGKVDRKFFREHISSKLGAKRADVLIPPGYGFDFGLIDLGRGRVMAVSTDPIWIERSFGIGKGAWFAFHSLVGDVALSGLPPSHLALDWNLPAGIGEKQFSKILEVFALESEKLGMTIVAGHTGVYEGSSFPTIGGGTALAVGRMGDVIRTDGAKPGDVVVLTKSPATEAAITLCLRYESSVREAIGSDACMRICRLFHTLSVVDDAGIAANETGVTSMHDASERGVSAALNEMSTASGVRIEFDSNRVRLNTDVERLCSFLKMDPFCCSSQGTLLLTARPANAEGVVNAFAEQGIESFIVGKVLGGEGVYEVAGGKRRQMRVPRNDHLLRGMSVLEGKERYSKSST